MINNSIIIAFVGGEETKWKHIKNAERKVKEHVRETILTNIKYKTHGKMCDFLFVSGGCHRGGVDIWAQKEANLLGMKQLIIPSEVKQWPDAEIELEQDMIESMIGSVTTHKLMGYMSRNILVAEIVNNGAEGSALFQIEPQCPTCKGKRVIIQGGFTLDCNKCKGKGHLHSGATFTRERVHNYLMTTTLKVIE